MLVAEKAPHVTIYDMVSMIYNYVSECTTTPDLMEKREALMVLVNEICNEVNDEIAGVTA